MDNANVIAIAKKLVSLFVWQETEIGGEVEPHLDKAYPDFNDTLTELRDALEGGK